MSVSLVTLVWLSGSVPLLLWPSSEADGLLLTSAETLATTPLFLQLPIAWEWAVEGWWSCSHWTLPAAAPAVAPLPVAAVVAAVVPSV